MSLVILLIAILGFWLYWRKEIRALRQRLTLAELSISELERRAGGHSAETPQQPDTPIEQPDGAPQESPSVPPSPQSQPAATYVDDASHAAATASTPDQSLEESLGTRWAVYVGGLALALGGIFLVHYTIEAGLIGPAMRLFLGFLLAITLIGLGEWFRRTDATLGIDVVPSAHVPSILTAAGTVTAFATVYAAHALFGFIGPTTAFIALGAIGIAGMFAAALHGPALAGLGLAGSFATPAIISTSSPNPWALVLFLSVIAGTAFLLARLRRWLWLAATTVAGAVAWGVAMLFFAARDGDLSVGTLDGSWLDATYTHAGLQMALTAVIIAILPHIGNRDNTTEPSTPDWVATICLAALTALALLILVGAPTSDMYWIPFATAMILILAATAFLSPPTAGAGVLSGIIVAGTALLWPALNDIELVPTFDRMTASFLSRPELPENYLWFLALAILPAVVLCVIRLWRATRFNEKTTGLYAVAATAMPLIVLIIAYMRAMQFEGSLYFMSAALLMAGMFAILAEAFFKQEHDLVQTVANRHDAGNTEQDTRASAFDASNLSAARVPTGAFAAAAISALAIALAVIIDRSLLKAALAVTALAIAWISTQRDIPILRHAVWALGLIIVARIVAEPAQMLANVGQVPIFNMLLLAYGIPAISFLLAGYLLRADRPQADLATHMCDGLAMIFTALLCFFEIHHVIHGGNVLATQGTHVELGLLALTALGLSQLAIRQGQTLQSPVYKFGSFIFAGLALVFAFFGLGFLHNPYFTGEKVFGWPVFSSLLLAYLLPGLMALYVARVSRGFSYNRFAMAASVSAVILIFLYVTLEVRHVFHGPKISMTRATTAAEIWAYTIAWLGLGIAFLGYGLWRNSMLPRIASAALIVMACIKVVLIDLSGVSNLWRALSFICLGAVLIGIGLVYQRLIFAKPSGNRATSPDSETTIS